MDEYIHEHLSLIHHDILLEEIKDIFYFQMEDHIIQNDAFEDDMNDLLEDAFIMYMISFYPNQEVPLETDVEAIEAEAIEAEAEAAIDDIEMKIERLRQIPQPVQRTPEWYKFRWNLITASSAWKAFETQSTMNQLIYEKCQPLREFNSELSEEVVLVNTNTTLHWGQKYEPLSVILYEHMYNSKVEDFGCIQHPKYSFIGASPDGIIIESETGRYGRMLEIKNIVNREINGIPKKEYWIQMQLQMEVCDLNECDFLETKFVEYETYSDYTNDSSDQFNKTADGNYKGQIIYFQTSKGSPHYEYMPLNVSSIYDVTSWEESTIHKYESEPYQYHFIKFIYWRLEKLSCVLVVRNRDWFTKNVAQLENIWNIIEQERISGYEHRAPNKRVKKEQLNNTTNEVCLLKVIKI
jgi:putative phage-type endonuclease